MDGPQQISMLRPSNTTEESSGDITQQQSAAAASLIFVHSCLLALDKGTVDQVKARLKQDIFIKSVIHWNSQHKLCKCKTIFFLPFLGMQFFRRETFVVVLGNSAHICPPPRVRFPKAFAEKRTGEFTKILNNTLELLKAELQVKYFTLVGLNCVITFPKTEI